MKDPQGQGGDAVRRGWTYSPDPDVERLVTQAREKYRPRYTGGIERTLNLLGRLKNPHLRLPPVFHAAGTNGKGSTLAFLQAALEAGGLSVHKYTSPHLVRFEERFTLNGAMIGSAFLADLIGEGMAAAKGCDISFFEFFTCLMLLAAARARADALLLEAGLGGRLDATNVVPGATAILTRVSFDHMYILGDTLDAIAAEKAAIMRKGRPVVVARQKDPGVLRVFADHAARTGAVPYMAGRDFQTRLSPDGFTYEDESRRLSLPLPALQGAHQIDNAGSAIAALARGGFPRLAKEDVLSRALRSARWPGRMQRLVTGPAARLLPEGWELWLDGAHNDSGAEVLAAQARAWGGGKPLHLVTAMKGNKDPALFYAQLSPHVTGVRVLGSVPGAPLLPAPVLCDYLRGTGFSAPREAENLESAVVSLTSQYPSPSRILITGSLYLAGAVLRDHG